MAALFCSKYLSLIHVDVLHLPEEVDWVKFNVDMTGYYMVHYAVRNGWSSINRLLKHNHTALTGNDRASLIHNVFQLVRSVFSTELLPSGWSTVADHLPPSHPLPCPVQYLPCPLC